MLCHSALFLSNYILAYILAAIFLRSDFLLKAIGIAEFFVWKNIQLELAAEGVYNKLFDFKADNEVTKEDFKRKTLEEKLKSLKEILNSLNFDEI